jgi:ribosomal protein L12E/L44/L45/RPP1/RPP2
MLLVLGGNATPTAADVTGVISSLEGAEIDEEKLTALIAVS